jgi:hypothetical protein
VSTPEPASIFLAGRIGAFMAVHAVGPDGSTACGLPASTTTGTWRGGRGSCVACARKVELLAQPRRPPLASWEQACGDGINDEDGEPMETCLLIAGHPDNHAGYPPLEWPRETDRG